MARIRKFRFERPQQLAAMLLFLLIAQSLWIVQHQTLTMRDYEFARCGREMWEKPSPLAGYFTSCGNMHDGTLAYRAAGLPLTLQRILKGQDSQTSTWEMRHELSYVRLLLRLPFIFAGVCLGAALWWVTRRLYGNTGGFIALAFYVFAPPVLHASTYPNNEILTAFALFAALYTAIGVAHAMHGPQSKWRSRILLLIVIFGFLAAAHVAAFVLAFLLAIVLMGYLAEGRRAYLIPILMMTIIGTLLLVFASYDFSPDAYSYYFRSGAARMWFSPASAARWFTSLPNAAMALSTAAALALYFSYRRSRYFGNTVPLLLALLFFPLITTGISGEPTLWGLPFLLTFIAGVFADVLETRHRRIFLAVAGSLLALQAAFALASVSGFLS